MPLREISIRSRSFYFLSLTTKIEALSLSRIFLSLSILILQVYGSSGFVWRMLFRLSVWMRQRIVPGKDIIAHIGSVDSRYEWPRVTTDE